MGISVGSAGATSDCNLPPGCILYDSDGVLGGFFAKQVRCNVAGNACTPGCNEGAGRDIVGCICKVRPPPPPPPPPACPAVAAHTWVVANLYQSCTSACIVAGKMCSTEPTLPTTEQCFLDIKEAMPRQSDGTFFGCNPGNRAYQLSGAYLPARNALSDKCFRPAPDGPAFTCGARDRNHERLCPCD